jgi:hypothetical protein
MPRRPATAEQVQVAARAVASRRLLASLPKRKGKATLRIDRSRVQQVVHEVRTLLAQRDSFVRKTSLHMVAVWAWCHAKVYGVDPPMVIREWALARIVAGAILQSDFGGRTEAMLPFLRWSWVEEKRSVEWRRVNDRPINPMGWRLQFSRKMVVRWRANGSQ